VRQYTPHRPPDRSDEPDPEEPLPPTRVDVVHVGSAARDIAPEDPRGWRLGGGVTYAALTTARLGLKTAAVVGVDAEAAGAHELDALRDAGVDIMRIDLPEGPIFHNVETAHGREQTMIARGVPVTPVALPASWSASRAWSLVPVAAEVDDEWAALIDRDAIVGVAWQGMLRRLEAGARVERVPPAERAILRRADLVGLSHLDVEPETSLGTLTSFLHPGARLLVTQGGKGGLLVTTDGDGPAEVLRYMPTPAEREIDPTGAGDTFLAALLAVLVRPGIAASPGRSLARGLRFAAAAGSLAVEDLGLAGVPDRSAVLIRRARERVRRAVVPSLSAQVGVEDPRQ
jgi:sugar/nucleoside kinase (ribokinase family)